MLQVGKVAPALTLKNQDGDKISLKDYRGSKNVVLYFYPKAMTPGCTTQACGLRDNHLEISNKDTIVLGISPDTPSKLLKFKEKHDLNFELLSDEDHKIAEKYGAWGLKKFMGKEYMGILRTTFIIGKDGKLKYLLDKFKTKDHNNVVLEKLEEL